jgi:xanthine dehydrogenase molybdopterin-binding subunit B
LRADGRFLAMRADNISNVGGRCVSLSPLGKGSALVTGSYDIPAASLRSRAVFTNTMPTNAYRSSGRPEVTYAIERLVDKAAGVLGFDRIELRRKNLVGPQMMPYPNAVGARYDSGTYEANMDFAMRNADFAGFAARRREAEARGKLLGFGLANYVESSIGQQTSAPRSPSRRVEVVIGTQPNGQGHETSFAQVVSALLSVPVAAIDPKTFVYKKEKPQISAGPERVGEPEPLIEISVSYNGGARGNRLGSVSPFVWIQRSPAGSRCFRATRGPHGALPKVDADNHAAERSERRGCRAHWPASCAAVTSRICGRGA